MPVWKVDFELNRLNKEANGLQKQIAAKKKVRISNVMTVTFFSHCGGC